VFLLAIIGSFSAALLLSWGLNWLALIPWRRTAGQHWAERARILYPIRVGARINVLFITATCVLAGKVFCHGDLTSLWLFGVFGFLGVIVGTYPFDREVLSWLRFQGCIHHVISCWLLLLGWLFVFIGAGLLMPEQFGWISLILAVVVFGIRLWLDWGLAFKLLDLLRILRPPPERLQRIVSETAQVMNVSVRRVWLLHAAGSYAAVFPTTRELIFSERLLELHPDEEVAAICAHELGHLTESRMVLAGRIVGSFTLFPLIFAKPLFHLEEPWNALAIMMLGIFVFSLQRLSRRLSRKMEVRADKVAAENAVNAVTYARALERLYEANQIPAVMRSNHLTHPHLYDRMLSAGVTPDYPRPKRPGLWAWNRVIGILLLIVIYILAESTISVTTF